MEIMGSYCTLETRRSENVDVTMSRNALRHKGMIFREHINILMFSSLNTIVVMVLKVKLVVNVKLHCIGSICKQFV